MPIEYHESLQPRFTAGLQTLNKIEKKKWLQFPHMVNQIIGIYLAIFIQLKVGETWQNT